MAEDERRLLLLLLRRSARPIGVLRLRPRVLLPTDSTRGKGMGLRLALRWMEGWGIFTVQPIELVVCPI